MHIAARVAATAEGSEVVASSAVTDLVAGAGLTFEPRAPRELKGIPGRWSLFSVCSDGARAPGHAEAPGR